MADKTFNGEDFKEEIEKLGLSHIFRSQVNMTVSRVCITIKYTFNIELHYLFAGITQLN